MSEELYVQEDSRRLANKGTIFRCTIRGNGKRLFLVRLDEPSPDNGQEEIKLFEERIGLFESRDVVSGAAPWVNYDPELKLSVGDRLVCTLVTDKFNQDQYIAGFGGPENSFLAAVGKRRAFGNTVHVGYRMPELYDLETDAEFLLVNPLVFENNRSRDPKVAHSRIRITEVRSNVYKGLDYVFYKFLDGPHPLCFISKKSF